MRWSSVTAVKILKMQLNSSRGQKCHSEINGQGNDMLTKSTNLQMTDGLTFVWMKRHTRLNWSCIVYFRGSGLVRDNRNMAG